MTECSAGWPAGEPVTVVIPALNAASTLGAQLEALRGQTYAAPFEVIVVDNGSTDATAAIAQSYLSDTFSVRVVSEPRRGVNLARNAGVAAAADGLIVLCDADDIVFPEWLESLTAAYVDGAWLAGDLDPELLNSEDTRQMWGVTRRVEHRGTQPYVDTAFGGNCAFTRRMWEDVGHFDETMSGHGDETEFFLRAWAHGYRVEWAPGAVIHYRLRSGLRVMARQKYRKGKSQTQMMTRQGGQLLDTPERRFDVKVWGYIVLMAPVAVFLRSVRYRWVRLSALRAGRIAGRLEHR